MRPGISRHFITVIRLLAGKRGGLAAGNMAAEWEGVEMVVVLGCAPGTM